MDALLEILCALILWRLVVSVSVSFFVALFLSQVFAEFTAGYCLILVLLGTCFGVIWHSRAEAGVGLLAPVPPTPISKPVAFLGFLVIGLFWGGLASSFLGSALFGAVALVLAVGVVRLWVHFVQRRYTSLAYLAFASASLLSGFGLLLFLKSLNA